MSNDQTGMVRGRIADNEIETCVIVRFRNPDFAARAEAMARDLVPDGCEISETRSFDGYSPGDPMAQTGWFGVKWKVQR